jgi:hypothetical protein
VSCLIRSSEVGYCAKPTSHFLLKGVQFAIAEDPVSVDHLVSPGEAIRIAMARQ